MTKYLLIALIAIGVFFLGSVSVAPQRYLGGGVLTSNFSAPRFTTSVTNASTSIGLATTSLIAAGNNIQYLLVTNLGGGNVYCAFGANAALTTGQLLRPTSTSGFSSFEIVDPNLLVKGVNCIADVTSTVAVLKY